MTEDAAKTKWCPMRRAESSGFDKVFGPMPSNGSAKCIGAACMMWRTLPQSAHYDAAAETAVVDVAQGYCGLAGKI